MTAIYEVRSQQGGAYFATEEQAKAYLEKIAPSEGIIVEHELNGGNVLTIRKCWTVSVDLCGNVLSEKVTHEPAKADREGRVGMFADNSGVIAYSYKSRIHALGLAFAELQKLEGVALNTAAEGEPRRSPTLADYENTLERIGHGWTVEQLVARHDHALLTVDLVRKMLEQNGCDCAYEHHPDCHAPSCADRCLVCRIMSVVKS